MCIQAKNNPIATITPIVSIPPIVSIFQKSNAFQTLPDQRNVPTTHITENANAHPPKKKSPLSFAHIKNKHYLCTDIDRVAFLVIW